MKFLIDDILVQEGDTALSIRKQVAERLGANYKNLRIEIRSRRYVRTEKGGRVRLSVLADTSEFLRSTISLAYVEKEPDDLSKLSWKERPVVAGFGIPGIAAAYYLAKRGLKPIVLERGGSLSARSHSTKEKETLNPDGEGGFLAHTGSMLFLDNLDSNLRQLLLDEGVSFDGPDAFRPLTPLQLRGIISKLHTAIVSMGGEIIFNATYLGVKRRFGKIKAVFYQHEGSTKAIKTSKLLLTYGASNDSYFIGSSIPSLPQNFNTVVYGRKTVEPKAAPYFSVHEVKSASSRGIFATGLRGARVMDIGNRTEFCLQTYNFDGKGRYVHAFVGVEVGKEEAEKICNGAFDASKPYRIPCSTVADFSARKNPLRLGLIKPENVGDIRLDNFAKLLGPNVSKRLLTVINHYSKTHPYIVAKDAILEGLIVLSGSKDGKPVVIDGIYVSRADVKGSFDFASLATSGYLAAKAMTCEK